MIDLTYNLSPILRNNLQKSDAFRKEILLTPISSKLLTKTRWKVLFNKIYYSFLLSETNIAKDEVLKILTSHSLEDRSGKKTTSLRKEIISYKKALDFIQQDWHVEKKNVILRDVLILYDMFIKGRLIIPPEKLRELLSYIQVQEVHPVIQSGLIAIGFLKLQPFSEDNIKISIILAYLFLFKYGYDVNGLIEFEKYWFENKNEYLTALEKASEGSNATMWLEFFSKSVSFELENISKIVKEGSLEISEIDKDFWKLNDRQKSILSLFEEPEIAVTNKKVQLKFKVSQITASRDLSKLSLLGFIFPRGKGRSIYYIRA